MMKKVLFVIITIVALLFAFFSCERMFDNPYDANSNKDTWAPDSVDYFVISANECELSWKLDEDRIDGFKIDKFVNNDWITNYAVLDKEARTWQDHNYIYDANKPVKYRIFAYAGQNQSTIKEVVVNLELPQLVIDSVYDIFDMGLTMTTRVTQNGKSRISKSGVCWSETSNPDTSDNYTINTYAIQDEIPYSYQQYLNELEPEKYYYIKAFVVNAVGINYSNQVEIITNDMPPTLPTVQTSEVVDVSTTFIHINGEVISQGSQPVTERGMCYSTSTNPDINDGHTVNGTGLGAFTAEITGLTANTDYYIRAYASNAIGVTYGEIIIVKTTEIQLPILTTTSVTNVTHSSAISGGVVLSSGGSSITARGVCWNTSQNPTISNYHTVDGSGTGSFVSNLDNLSPITTYYVRAYATNELGTSYGQEISFTTIDFEPCGVITDSRDGKTYQTVQIGEQCWMAENLKYLPNVVGPGTGSQTTPHYYVYGYNGTNVTDAKATANYNTYGVLYNWPAAMNGAASSTTNPSGVQGVCPDGWHLPSDAEWTELTDYLGGTSDAGGKLKETGTTHWNSPNTGATNETGFTALPGGSRSYLGTFDGIGSVGYWWSATEDHPLGAWYRSMLYSVSGVGRSNLGKVVGCSVRCLRD